MVKTGSSLDSLLELPMAQFMALFEAMLRVDAREKTDSLWTARVAQHGEPKEVRKLEDMWQSRCGSKEAKHKQDLKALLKLVGKGF